MYKIIANWKMYLTIRQSRELAAQMAQWWKASPCQNVECVVCPSDVALRDVVDQLHGSGIRLGAQSLSLSAKLGAFTGQSSGQQLREAGCEYVLLGHSEQRQFFHVSNDMVRQQLQAAAANRLHPVVCIGETAAERKAHRTDSVVVTQLEAILTGLAWPATGLSVAYEPVWAIGTGNHVDPAEANRVHQLIKHTLQEFFGEKRAQDTAVLYGGSVNRSNFGAFLQEKTVSGLLIGSASTKPQELQDIISRIQSDYCSI